jgi:CDP-paratose 2-epimerase
MQREISTFSHHDIDVRDSAKIERVFAELNSEINVVVHAAAQPSHDWAANDPMTDFSVNAGGTFNLLEMTRRYAPNATFIFTSTNKVYGDAPNHMPLRELDMRWEVDASHPFYEHGINESLTIDQTNHSLFGASKLAADVIVQEYGRYFGLNTVVFRAGCLTGPGQTGAPSHGFLSHLVDCVMRGTPYTILGYKGKQVRDNLHCNDLAECFWEVHRAPRSGEVYNIGGGRFSHCSVLEAIAMSEDIIGKKLTVSYSEVPRKADHLWWISDTRKFQLHYPGWKHRTGLKETISEIADELASR